MLALDTNHMSEVVRQSAIGKALVERLDISTRAVATTVIPLQVMLRGWLSRIRQERDPLEIIPHYAKLQEIAELICYWTALPWNAAATSEFPQLPQRRLRVATMDLKIASIALAANATLLSRNLGDFQRIPNLSIENRLE